PDGTVIDGEILPFIDRQIANFNSLQTRIGRKNLTASLLKNTPVILKAYDLLEWQGEDLRDQPYIERRKLLEDLFNSIKADGFPLHLSERVQLKTWDDAHHEREKAREYNSEGLMFKRNASPYLVGRKKGDW